jgi:hypothetical protein
MNEVLISLNTDIYLIRERKKKQQNVSTKELDDFCCCCFEFNIILLSC